MGRVQGRGDSEVRALAGGGSEIKGTAEGFNALAHVRKSIALAARGSVVRLETAPIIFDQDLQR